MDKETMQQFAEILDAKLTESNKAIFAQIDGVRTEMQEGFAAVDKRFAEQNEYIDKMLHDQTESVMQMAQRMDDALAEKITKDTADTIMRRMEVLLENNQDKKIQALYEDHEAVKEDVRQLKAKVANE